MVFSDYIKQRILSLTLQGNTVKETVECLVLEDQILVSKQGVRQFLKRFAMRGTIARKPGSGVPPKLSPAILKHHA
jgi:DNA-binding GntR family transcriptional regulator